MAICCCHSLFVVHVKFDDSERGICRAAACVLRSVPGPASKDRHYVCQLHLYFFLRLHADHYLQIHAGLSYSRHHRTNDRCRPHLEEDVSTIRVRYAVRIADFRVSVS